MKRCRHVITASGRDGLYTRQCSRNATGGAGLCMQHYQAWSAAEDRKVGEYIRRNSAARWNLYRRRHGSATNRGPVSEGLVHD